MKASPHFDENKCQKAGQAQNDQGDAEPFNHGVRREA
jgi:hypothetical protein